MRSNSTTKERRLEQIRKRKNFLPTLIVTTFLWVLTGALVYFVDPGTALAVPAFFILIFLCFLFTFSTIFANRRRGLLTAVGLSVFLILRFFGIGHYLNFILIVALGICIELYFNRIN